ncbi:MAG TPA: prolyl oligopeptidase family serine peptidase, partial [bacterium]|nr:prolyl oligopeptidase family serine peptidase [bacterium]
ERFLAEGELPAPEILFQPDDHTTILLESGNPGVSTSRSAVWIALLRDVRGELVRMSLRPETGWSTEKVALPENGTVSIASANDFDDTIFVNYTDFVTPTRLLEITPEAEVSVAKTTPERFDASGVVVEQFFAESSDGTRIPYFLVRPEGAGEDGPVPTMLYGYGGFQLSQKSQYISSWGKLWLERGGAFARANIRGGGEYGPSWHQAAQRENRQVSHDDFHAVAEDLIARGVTDGDHLGIMGGSQGGLLVGVAMTQRPDLYAATVCQVPLLDMMRYHLLPPGASWMAEYGDPEDPEMAKAIAAYSPYQNVKPGVEYRNVFFVTSTKDDRVHPGHARKMAARMEELGQAVRYYENIEGGHAAGANRNQTAYRVALEFTHLSQALGMEPGMRVETESH